MEIILKLRNISTHRKITYITILLISYNFRYYIFFYYISLKIANFPNGQNYCFNSFLHEILSRFVLKTNFDDFIDIANTVSEIIDSARIRAVYTTSWPRMFARTWPKILSHVRLHRALLPLQHRSMRLIVCHRELCRDDIP